jgi:hypothetical protein
MKAVEEKNRPQKDIKRPAKRTGHKAEEIKTDPPLSEKDEVKKAEQNTQKNVRRNT